MHEIKWRDSGYKQFKFMDSTVLLSSHKRSKSYPVERRVGEDTESSCHTSMLVESNESKKRQYHNIDLQSSLTQEILMLQKRLHQQVVVRSALEKACYLPFSQDAAIENSMPMATKELIKEIGVLELEVVYLEQYLLSLYRKRFDHQILSLSAKERRLGTDSDPKTGSSSVTISEKEISVPDNNLLSPRNSVGFPLKECKKQLKPDAVLDSSIHRCHSTLSQQSVCYIETSQAKAFDTFHSLPLSMLEQAQSNNCSSTCLADHLGNCFSDIVPETANWLSEEMIKSISAIYCELADPPFVGHHDNASTFIRFSSSVYGFPSSQDQQGNKQASSLWKNHRSFNLNFNNPFHVKGSKEFNGPYCSMVKIQRLSRDSEKLKEVEYMLRRFRSLVSRLEDVNPRNLEHEEKLAFWINVHNTLVMHALLVYGISANNAKRISTVLKAAYNIGGHNVSVELIQNCILECRLPRPGQWLQILFPSKTKLKVRDARKAYAIHRPEPLLLFALSSGSRSDPAVRLYTSKRVLEELESAKEDYIQSTISVTKEQKIFVPKIVDFFAKSSRLGASGLMEMVKNNLPDSQRRIIHEFQSKASWKGIELIPHNFSFNYLISKELAW